MDLPGRLLCRAMVLVSLVACGGRDERAPAEPVAPLAPRADDEFEPGSKSTTCADALARVEQLVGGDLDRAQTAGPIEGFEGFTTRVRWFEGCERFSAWTRRCLVLSTARDELSSCAPGNQPWSRRFEFGNIPPEEKERFLACVNGAADRAALASCQYDP